MPGVARQCCSIICQCTRSTKITQQKCPSIISPSLISVCICPSACITCSVICFSIHRCKHSSIHPVSENFDQFPLQQPAAMSSPLQSPQGIWYTCFSKYIYFSTHCTFGALLGNILKFLSDKIEKPRSTKTYHCKPQAHRCAQIHTFVMAKPVSSGSPLSRSRPWATHSFWRPPPLNFPPTCQSRQENVNTAHYVLCREGCTRVASGCLHLVLSDKLTKQ